MSADNEAGGSRSDLLSDVPSLSPDREQALALVMELTRRTRDESFLALSISHWNQERAVNLLFDTTATEFREMVGQARATWSSRGAGLASGQGLQLPPYLYRSPHRRRGPRAEQYGPNNSGMGSPDLQEDIGGGYLVASGRPRTTSGDDEGGAQGRRAGDRDPAPASPSSPSASSASSSSSSQGRFSTVLGTVLYTLGYVSSLAIELCFSPVPPSLVNPGPGSFSDTYIRQVQPFARRIAQFPNHPAVLRATSVASALALATKHEHFLLVLLHAPGDRASSDFLFHTICGPTSTPSNSGSVGAGVPEPGTSGEASAVPRIRPDSPAPAGPSGAAAGSAGDLEPGHGGGPLGSSSTESEPDSMLAAVGREHFFCDGSGPLHAALERWHVLFALWPTRTPEAQALMQQVRRGLQGPPHLLLFLALPGASPRLVQVWSGLESRSTSRLALMANQTLLDSPEVFTDATLISFQIRIGSRLLSRSTAELLGSILRELLVHRPALSHAREQGAATAQDRAAEEVLRAREAAHARTIAAAEAETQRERLAAEAEARAAQAEATRQATVQQERAVQLERRRSQFPAEPSRATPNVRTFRFVLPDGQRVVHRFRGSDPFGRLTDYMELFHDMQPQQVRFRTPGVPGDLTFDPAWPLAECFTTHRVNLHVALVDARSAESDDANREPLQAT